MSMICACQHAWKMLLLMLLLRTATSLQLESSPKTAMRSTAAQPFTLRISSPVRLLPHATTYSLRVTGPDVSNIAQHTCTGGQSEVQCSIFLPHNGSYVLALEGDGTQLGLTSIVAVDWPTPIYVRPVSFSLLGGDFFTVKLSTGALPVSDAPRVRFQHAGMAPVDVSPEVFFQGGFVFLSGRSPPLGATAVLDMQVLYSLNAVQFYAVPGEGAVSIAAQTKKPYKIGFMMHQAIKLSNGYTYWQNMARLSLPFRFGARVDVSTFVENKEGWGTDLCGDHCEGPNGWCKSDPGCPRGLTHVAYVEGKRMIEEEGCDMVVGITYEYWADLQQLAKEYPNKKFLQTSPGQGTLTPNFARVLPVQHQAVYTLGYSLGQHPFMQKNKKAAYIAAEPSLKTNVAAFAKGFVDAVGPEARVFLIYTKSWGSVRRERVAAERLFKYYDVAAVATICNTLEGNLMARKYNRYSGGLNLDVMSIVGPSVVTSMLQSWDAQQKFVGAAMADVPWGEAALVNTGMASPPLLYLIGAEEGGWRLTAFSHVMPMAAKKKALAREADFQAGHDDVWCNRMRDPNTGAVVNKVIVGGAPGACVDVSQIDWDVYWKALNIQDSCTENEKINGFCYIGAMDVIDDVPDACADGYTLTAEGCKACPQGKRSKFEECVYCSEGTFSDQPGLSECKSCNASTASAQAYTNTGVGLHSPPQEYNGKDGAGLHSCQRQCSSDEKCVGMFSMDQGMCWLVHEVDEPSLIKGAAITFYRREMLTACSQCTPGKFQDDIAATDCKFCSKGTYGNLAGQESCERCPLGTFSNASGRTACTKCPSSFTTQYPGAMQPENCICMIGSYNGEILHGSNTGCMMCGEGLKCNTPGLLQPNQDQGYYILNGRPDQVYLCEPKGSCLGGAWGESVCRTPRLGFLCMECPDGLVLNTKFDQNPDGCVGCSSFASIMVVLAPFIIFFICLGVMYFTHASPLDEKPIILDAQNTIGQLVMFVQVVNAILSTRMSYGEPMDGFMSMLIAQLDPDKIFSSAPCLASSMSDPVGRYSLLIVSPVTFIIFLSIAYLIGKLFFNNILPLDGLFNIVGEVLVEFYISITLAIFSPFNCYGHPNGDSSVRNYPQIICGESKHGGMVALAVFGILAFPLTAMVVSVFMTWQHPRSMLKNDIRLLVRGRFLFDRWTPDCYWFCNVSLVRNFCIAVLPCLMPEDGLDVTVLLMALTLLVAFILLVWFKPRRSPKQNRLDCFISFTQVTLVLFGVTSVYGNALRESLSTACVVMMMSVIFAVMALLCHRSYQLVTKAVAYSLYLSHHSGAGGASCRVLHNVVLKSIQGGIFYDMDFKESLGSIIDAARDSLNMLVVFGSETLCRPWCIASIVCAYRRGTPLHTVILTHPNPEETVCSVGGDSLYSKAFSGRMPDNSRGATFEVDTFILRGHGLSQQDVQPAIQAITAVEPVFMHFLSEDKLNANLDALFARMVSILRMGTVAAATESLFRGANRCAQFKEGNHLSQSKITGSNVNLILCDHFDGDAISVSRLLQSVFSQKETWLEDQDLPSADFATVVRAGKALNALFVFSQNSLKSVSQLSRLGLLFTSQPEMHMVPVAVGVAFEFPDQDFLQKLEAGKALDLGANPMRKLATCAGGQVSLKQIANGLAHVMSFRISFVNVPCLSGRVLDNTLLDILSRATGSGRRISISKQGPLVPLEAERIQDGTPEPAEVESV